MSYDASQETIIGRRAIAEMCRDIEANEERNNFRWEGFTDAFVSEIRNAAVYVDCGAEFGFYIRLALKYGRPDIRILAFECERARYDLLVESFGGYPNVEIYPYAVSNVRTTRSVKKPAQGASLTFANEVSAERFPEAKQSMLEVESIVFDEFVGGLPVDVLKMDIEGAEVLALPGMTSLLKRDRTSLFVEFHPRYIPTIRPDGVEALQRLFDETRYAVFDGYGARSTISASRVVLRPPSKMKDPWPVRPARTAPVKPVLASMVVQSLYAQLPASDDAVPAALAAQLKSSLDALSGRTDIEPLDVYRIASLFKRLCLHDDARAWFARLDAPGLSPATAAGAQFHLGEMRLQEGDGAGAARHFRQCLALTPGHARAAARLASLPPADGAAGDGADPGATASAYVAHMRELWNTLCQKNKLGYISFLRNGAHWDAKEFHTTGIRFVDRMMERFLDYAAIEPSYASVLEIGCGVGRFLKPLACRFQSVTGVDISKNMLEAAGEYLAGLPNVTLALNDGSTLKEFQAGSFDFCVSAGVFQHITHRDVIVGYVREALRVLAPGGLLLFQFEGTRTDAIGSGCLGARLTAHDLEQGLADVPFRIREISLDPADAVRNVVIVLQKPRDGEETAAGERAFSTVPMIERRWLRGVYDDVKTETQMHERHRQTPKRMTFYD